MIIDWEALWQEIVRGWGVTFTATLQEEKTVTAMDTNSIERRLTEWRRVWPGGEWNIKVYSRGHINVYAWFGGRSFEQDFTEGDLTHKILSEVETGLEYITRRTK